MLNFLAICKINIKNRKNMKFESENLKSSKHHASNPIRVESLTIKKITKATIMKVIKTPIK